MTLAWVQWINPWWAAALPLAVAIPLLAHMWRRDTPREVLLPTVRFALAATASYQQWARPRHRIILAGRATILALMVAALTGPRWVTHSAATDLDGGWNVVLIVDRSASMTRSKHGSTLFDEAKQRAIDVIESLDPSGDRASVVLLDANPTLLLPQPTANFSLLVDRLTHTQPTFQYGDLPAALQQATTVSGGSSGSAVSVTSTGHAEFVDRATKIYLISDMQATQWFGDGRAVPLGMSGDLILHTIAGPDDNVAVSRPRVTPPRPVAGQPATVSVDVSRYLVDEGRSGHKLDPGYDRHAGVTVELQIDGQRLSRSVVLTHHETRTVQFDFTPSQPGPVWVEAALSDPQGSPHRDALPSDDRTGLFIHVNPTRHVAMVTDRDPDNPTHAAYYLARALVPDVRDISAAEQIVIGDAAVGSRESSRLAVRLTTWPTRELARRLTPMRTGLSPRPDAIVIVEAGRLDQQALSALHRYLESGGVVVWIIDSQPGGAAFAQFLDQPIGHDSTERISSVDRIATVDLPQDWRWHGSDERSLGWAAFDHPVLKIFEGPARANLLRQRFTATLTWQSGSGFDSLLAFDDGTPALTCRWVGAGRLAVFAGDWSPRHSDWVKDPLFVPLVHQLLRELVPSPRGIPIVHPGQRPTIELASLAGDLSVSAISTPLFPVSLSPSPGLNLEEPFYTGPNASKLICLGPDAQPVPFSLLGDRPSAIRLNEVSLPGRYTVKAQEDQTMTLGGVYVEIDPAESDLRVRDPSQSGDAWDAGTLDQNADGDDGRGHGHRDDSQGDPSVSIVIEPRPATTPLWPYAVFLAVVLAAIEPVVVAWVWDKSRQPDGSGDG